MADASSCSITSTPTVFNRFTVSNARNPLPVTLVEFLAAAEGPAVRLRWATAPELSFAGLTVERSREARALTAIGTVAGNGTRSTRHS